MLGSLEILRQNGLDWWTAVCVTAAGGLVVYAVTGRIWKRPLGWIALPLIALAVGGTTGILLLPALHQPLLGMVWTFAMLVLLSVTFYLNLWPELGNRRASTLLAMRIIALALVTPMLFEPVVRRIERPKPQRPLLFVIDVSGSMSFPDIANGPSRLQSVWQTLRPQLPRISEHFVPGYFTFATHCKILDDPQKLATMPADGASTDILGALSAAQNHNRGRPAEIILISDGIDNTSGQPAVIAAARQIPSTIHVHTLIVGSDQAEPASMPNVAVDNLEGPDDFLVGHEGHLKATISSTALANRVVEVKFAQIDAQGKTIGPVTSQPLVLQPLPQGQMVDLTYKPTKTGIQRLAVWIDPIPGERSTADNRQEFQGLALDPRIKVLYIEGSPRPEYKYLRAALAADQNIEVATLLRIQENRFTANGQVDEEPFTHFPSTTEEWKKFDVIILGDLKVSFLSQAQQNAIEQACGDGAGLLMIGGQENFGPGNFQGSAIEKALPVFVGDAKMPQESQAFVPRLTGDGAAHPAMEGLADWFGVGGQGPKIVLPNLTGNVVVAKAKSGAQVLLIHPGRSGPDQSPQIVLACQFYGKGRSMAFTADTTWRWCLPLAGSGQESPYKRFWGQMIRWLASADVRKREHGPGVDALLNKNLYQLGEKVHLRAMVRDLHGDATEYATVHLLLSQGSAKPQQFPLRPVESRRGMYDIILDPPAKGDWKAELIATKDGHELGRETLPFTVIPPADEMFKLAANTSLMNELANVGGGFAYRVDQLPKLLDALINSDPAALAAHEETIPLANTIRAVMAWMGHPPTWPQNLDLPMQGGLVFLLLAAEWMMRRWWRLG